MNKEKSGAAIPEHKIAEAEMPDEDQALLIERPDGFYWQSKLDGKIYGPFATMIEAMEDTQAQNDDDDYVGHASLNEVEAEIGIADWVDADTGELAEGSQPHLCDE